MTTPVLETIDLVTHFPIRQGVFGRVAGHVRAVDGVSISVAPGEALGLVGESGCGKTTLGRSILRLVEPTRGQVRILGQDMLSLRGEELRRFRRHAQMIFQDPYGSLNPRLTVGDAVTEPMIVHGLADKRQARDHAVKLIERVGLKAEHLDRYPHQFSGGQRQRIGIARALGLEPKLVVCDEPVSALDVSVQAQVLNLLRELQRERGLSYLFISHDLGVVSHLCDRVAVMYLGEIVEIGPVASVLAAPLHPYTQALLSAVPGSGHTRIILAGDPPSPKEPPSPERIARRFPRQAKAFQGELLLREAAPGHFVRCADLGELRRLAALGAAAWTD